MSNKLKLMPLIYDIEQVCFYCLKLSLQRLYLCLSFPTVVGVDCKSVRSPHPNRGILNMTLNCIWWWDFSSEDLESVKFLFIAITPRSTLAQSENGDNALSYFYQRFITHLLFLQCCYIFFYFSFLGRYPV